jgi:pimeloyl-ACP methyl ester carboxylesterase
MASRSKKILKSVVIIIALIIACVPLFIFGAAFELTQQAYHVPQYDRDIVKTAEQSLGEGTLEVSFVNDAGDTVPGWYHAGRNGSAIILLHGLRGTRAQLVVIARRLLEEGFGVLLIDQRGHGEHSCDITTLGRAESLDALAAIKWLRERQEVNGDKIGLFGASMGAATCIYAAATDPAIACAVADSSYATLAGMAYHDLSMPYSVARAPGFMKPLIVDAFFMISGQVIGKWIDYPDPVDVVGNIKCPLLLFHGQCDRRIDPSSFDELCRAAENSGVNLTSHLMEGEEHCKYHDSEIFLSELMSFFKRYLDPTDPE